MEKLAPASSGDAFVGRDADLARMRSLVDEAFAGRGHLVLLSGEAGVGKTSFAEHVAAYAEGLAAAVLWGTCWGRGEAPAFWPWIQVVRAYERRHGRAVLLDDLGDGAADVTAIVQQQRPSGRSDGDPEQVRFRVFDSFATFLMRAARRQPLLVVIDDLHVADAPSIELLRFVLPELRSSRLMLLPTYRQPDAEGRTSLVADLVPSAPRTMSVALAGLDQDDVARLVAGLTGETADDRLVTWVYGHTGGNPFFVKELMRLLASPSGADLHRRIGSRTSWIPETVRGVLLARTKQLSSQSADLLRQAAVLGCEFDLDLLPTITGADPYAASEAASEAVHAAVLLPVADTPRRYAFVHSLMRETLYEELPAARRATLHAKAATTLERLAGAGMDTSADQLAYHFWMAGPSGDLGRAADYAERAGRDAIARLGYEEAVGFFRQALDAHRATHDDGPRTVALLIALGDANVRAGDWPEALRAYRRAADEAERLGRPRELARAALGLGTRLGGFEVRLYDREQIDLLTRALAALGEGDADLRAWLLARLSVALSFVESVERRWALSCEAVELAERVGDRAAMTYAYAARCDALAGPAHVDERRTHAGDVIRLARETGDLEMEMLGRRLHFVALLKSGELLAADSEADAFAVRAERLRLPLYLWCVPLWRGMRAMMAGRLDECEQLNRDVRAIGRRARSDNAALLAQSQRVCWLLEAGREHEALQLCEREFRPAEFPASWPWMTMLLAKVGRDIEAAALLVARDFTDVVDDAQWLGCLACIAEACQLLRHRDGALAAYRRLSPFQHRFALTGTAAACFGSVSRHLGMLAHVLGRWEDATAHFERALRDNRLAGAPLLVAHTLRAYAGMLLDRGAEDDQQKAQDLAREALAMYHELGLDHRAEDAGSLLAGTATVLPEANVFRRQGDVWSLAFEGKAVLVKDAKGLHDIARLLATPDVDVHVRDLVGAAGPGSMSRRGAPAGMEPGDLGPVLDEPARRQYRQRITALDQEITEAESFGDAERAERARAERAWIAAELASAYGLGGRPRVAGDPVERARQAVKWRVRQALERIDKAHPALGRHLRNSIRTGVFCSYVPEKPTTWTL